MDKLGQLQERIGYRFRDEALLRQALTHTSYGGKDNERLEFLGDAVLELCASRYLFETYPAMREGRMSRARAAAVCEKALFRAAQPIGLGEYLFLGKSEEHTGGRQKPSVVSDAFEALIGAIYCEGGMEAAEAFILRHVPFSVDDPAEDRDCKTRLQELLQQHGTVQIVYQLLEESGPDHDKRFVSEVRCDGAFLGKGEGKSKKESEQAAARAALLRLSSESERACENSAGGKE